MFEKLHVLLLNHPKYKSYSWLKCHARTYSSPGLLHGEVDKFNGVKVDLTCQPERLSLDTFRVDLRDSLHTWQLAGRRSVWLSIPLHLSHLIQAAADEGFEYHHASARTAVLTKWIESGTASRLPNFVTHQIGVAGIAIDENNQELLVVKDKAMPHIWKFPGGVSNLGEDIGRTAEREVFEETGVVTEFRSVLAFRQQHDFPELYGRSDLYVVCRMHPRTTHIRPCSIEVADCRWMSADHLGAQVPLSPMARRLVQIIKHGLSYGFSTVDLERSRLSSIHKGKFFDIYHAKLSEKAYIE